MSSDNDSAAAMSGTAIPSSSASASDGSSNFAAPVVATVTGVTDVAGAATVTSVSAVAVLRINGAFGIAGLMRAIAFSDNLSSYKELCTQDGRKFAFRLVRFVGGRHVIIALDGIKDRTQALALKGTNLYVHREDLQEVASSDEYYVCDLVGKRVNIADHDTLDCKIVAVHNFGAGDLIEISYQSDTFMVPFRKEYFPQNESDININSNYSDDILMTFEAFCNFK